MIPTRIQIQVKIDKLKRKTSITDLIKFEDQIRNWLESRECPEKDIVKILEDLGSYNLK